MIGISSHGIAPKRFANLVYFLEQDAGKQQDTDRCGDFDSILRNNFGIEGYQVEIW